MNRKGEKIGWIGGWHGGFIWLGLLAIVWLFQNKTYDGVIGITIFIVASITIVMTAPWKHPNTRYWKLMLPIYFLLLVSVIFSIYVYGGFENSGLNWASLGGIASVFVPLFAIGSRRWNNLTKE